MAAHVERGAAPGLSMLVSRRGEVHVDAIGTTEVGGAEPMGRDTIFRVSSMTKPVTGVATLILVEDCVLRLDDPIDEWVPELADRQVLRSLDGPVEDTVPADRPITVRDLLTFRLGHGMLMAPPDTPIVKALDALELGDGPPRPSGPPEPDEWLRRLGTVPLVHQPGEQWLYNTGAEILGILIARASGRPLGAFLQERIFEPLGMADTGFMVADTETSRLPPSYLTDPGTGELTVFDPAGEESEWSRPARFPSGGAGLVSTLDDFLAFGQMLLNKGQLGGVRLLSRPSVEAMTTDQLTPAQKEASDNFGFFEHHGFGFCVGIVNHRHATYATPGAFGWDGGLGTSFWVDPDEDMVTLLMTQAAWTSPVAPASFVDFWTAAHAAIDD
jgi:CubicO group peptidase (beta-lactamase class C family)